ncbi:MAG TPA: ATP-binding protein [Polyangiaceae bacterium]|nr:ATP-binding protein [Polyangiaceae bacterium]
MAFRVAERERMEERLRQAQKMEAIGSLAGGVAHDFNNLLSVILGFVELVLDDLRPGEQWQSELTEVRRAGERARDLTRQLLAFSRKQVLKPVLLDLNVVLLEMEAMLRRLLGSCIELTVVTAVELGAIKADRGQLEQVIMNLVINARDAMQSTGGRLRIETSSVDLDASEAEKNPDLVPGSYVLLVVADNGAGMEPAVRARIFEPFFTTKGRDQGTGLGLATVFGIVRQSGGHIAVESEPGAGTTFRLYFRRESGAVLGPPVAHRSTPSLRGSETVLLVEDDASVRSLARIVLSRSGYNVLEAASPGEALLIVEQFHGEIHLLLTDVVMPRLSGVQLVERLEAQRPHMKVLYMSGYTDSAIVHAGVVGGGVNFLQKPITPELLLHRVREALSDS